MSIFESLLSSKTGRFESKLSITEKEGIRMKRFKKSVISLTTAFVLMFSFFMPCCKVYAETSEEQNFYHWWVVEKTTEDWVSEHGGGGFHRKFNAAEALDTEYGLTTEDLIYNCTGLTREDYEAYVNQRYGDVNWFNPFTNAFYGVPVTETNSQLYATSRANRVDNEGNIKVKGSNFWRSVYNQLFSGNGYKDQYKTESGNDYYIPKYDINIRYIGFCDANYNNSFPDVPKEVVSPYIDSGTYQTTDAILKIEMNGVNTGVLGITVNGYYMEGPWGRFTSASLSGVYPLVENNKNYLDIEFTYTDNRSSGDKHTYIRLKVNVTSEDITSPSVSVKQPSQVGFIKFPLGQKTPIYTPDSGEDNPFYVNPDGTVTLKPDTDGYDEDGDNDYDVWIDPDELSVDGWEDIFKMVNDDDNGDPSYNPYGRPWNTQDDNTILGGFFSNLVKDISALFSNIANAIKDIFNTLKNLPKFIADGIMNFLNKFLDFDVDILDIDVDNFFDIITAFYHEILQMVGVE